jgi:hypothetical protein
MIINFSYVLVNKGTFVKLFRMIVLCQMAACIICINRVELYEVVTERGGGGEVSRCQ